MRRSRLTKKNENKTKKTIILSVLGIVVILFFLFKFGLEILINFSLFLSGSGNQQFGTNQNQINFVAAPILNPIVSATNSAQIIIAGKSDKKREITLYINNSNMDQTQTDDNGNFNFLEELKSGENQINVKAKYQGKESDFSNTLTVVYLNSQPKLDVLTPSDGQQFKKDQNTVLVSGETGQGVKVTINGFWAIIDDNNKFSYTLPLQNGDNQIKIIATDQAGNTTEKDLKANYSQ